MAYNNDQNPTNLPIGDNNRRRSSDHLPRYFRTRVNNKFLSSTIDQLMQPGSAEKLNGYFGQKEAKGFRTKDFYIGDVNKQREDYQFEPSSVIKDSLGNISFYSDYNDYVNQLSSLGSSVSDHSLLNRQEYYSWKPNIDWDKFVNFREYYWLPTGPRPIQISGEKDNVVKTIKVTAIDNGENYGYVFTPDGLTQNPVLTLFRGITYKFEINAKGNPLSFRTKKDSAPIYTPNFLYEQNEKVNFNGGIYICNSAHVSGVNLDLDLWDLDTSFNLSNVVSENSIELGTIEVTLDQSTPDLIYYMSDNDLYASNVINVLDITEATSINVEEEIIGTKTYKTESNVELSNGMKIEFVGKVTPEKYATGFWYVEGVGDGIMLRSEEDLNVPSSYTSDLIVEFDTEGFDELPYSEAIGYPSNKDYITINRASQDGNLWSKYNRWFHKSVIEKSAEINNQPLELDQSARATRPIIEFEPNLKLFNYGTVVKKSIDLVDDFTKDAFSTIEGSEGYNIDNVDLSNGMRVLFTADNDPLVYGKIFEVKFINFRNRRQITLTEVDDSQPLLNEVVLCKQGTEYKGKMLWFNGTLWKLAQQKLNLNQPPLFDIFNESAISYSDSNEFESTTFKGTELFSYKIGLGVNDSELGFPLTYRSIENVGDIVFEYDLSFDTLTYAKTGETPITASVNRGYLRKYTSRTEFEVLNGWTKATDYSTQSVIRQYVNDNTRTFFTVDVYERSGLLDDLWLRVFVNNSLKFKDVDYTTSMDANENLTIKFNNLSLDDNIVIKTRSAAEKTENGKYEIPSNLERNPLNTNVNEFTLGEINDHVGTIVEEINEFNGIYPGTSNLRDLKELSGYGKRIVKHSSPLNLPLYHIVDKDANVIKAIKYARREYGKFKRSFLQHAADMGFSGPVKEHVDLILKEMNKDKTKLMPYYFSDMIPYTGSTKFIDEITDPENNFFALSKPFNTTTPSDTAVQVYINGQQLIYGKDYTFNDQGFIIVTASKAQGDIIEIYEYESTNGSFVPPTPTKLGIYPKFIPEVFVDDTYQTPTKVIQGHDGSITVAYDDFRDDLILELEKRIFNNLKVEYNTELFDIYDYVPGYSRNTGLTLAQLNKSMISDFVQWLQLVDSDYTKHEFFVRENTFTFNHTGMTTVQGQPVNGWWRAVYKYAYDTDRPHTHPWEMQAFSIKPTWWDAQYGQAPYTKNNFLMWEDIEAGIIRTPNTLAVPNEKIARKNLTAHIPVDDDGNLVSPVLSSFVESYNTTTLDNNFTFGDHSPVENAWRRSSEYAFALISSLILNQPANVFSTAFDRVRQIRGLTGNIVYDIPNTQIRLNNIQFPNTSDETDRVYTSGLIDYISNYLSSNVDTPYDEYKENLRNVDNQIGFKLGGFTTKDKFKLILDSRTPTNKGNVFIPEENYQIFLNTSAPIKSITYSGVIVEKQSYGFVIKGYDQESPYFNYYPAVELQNDPLVRIGGISASFVEWNANKTYVNGSIIEHQNTYYRVTETHTSNNEFDDTKVAKIPKLPEEGGSEAYFRKAFANNIKQLPYGSVFETIQEVVDFMLGYNQYLETEGFVFDYYAEKSNFVSNWETSAKEFMFWTTQNWGAGSVITLSPGAFQLKFNSQYAVVDDIYDTFYGYSLLKADGKKLLPQNVSLTRENPQEFVIRPKATEDGIYSVRLSLVQKEHVVVIDNKTVFGDIIYDQEPGYRQERIKVLGYRSGDWDGSINIPGFVYDNVTITEWKSWKDYSIGDVVKYKEFYYIAKNKVPGTEVFIASQWSILSEKPEAELLPNFEYKTNQFADFYDLDTDNFDLEQQKFAQHLIGYQNREYLANIINDDVSQYKFYQGMIQDKGTQNSLTKLFDVLGSADKDSLDFYEEWAIKVGQYGAAAGFEEVEYILDEDKFKLQPQSVELVNSVTGEETDLIYRIRPFETYLTPENYTHTPFPTKYIDNTYTKTAGYVNSDDVDFIIDEYNSIVNINYDDIRYNHLVWVGNVGQSWNVYTFIKDEIFLESVTEVGDQKELSFNVIPNDLNVNDIIGVEYTDEENNKIAEFVKITKILNNKITVNSSILTASEAVTNPIITKFVSVRVSTLEEAGELIQTYKQGIKRIWIDDDGSGEWKVFNNTPGFNVQQTIENSELGTKQNYAQVIAASNNNTLLVVGSPDDVDGKVFTYIRAGNSGSFQLNQIIDPDQGLAKSYPSFRGGERYTITDIVVFNKEYYEATNTFTSTVVIDIDTGENETIDQTWIRYQSNFIKIDKPVDIQRFGASLAVSSNGNYLIVGSPNATEVNSTYQGDYQELVNYSDQDIVVYKDNIWQANKNVLGAIDNIPFGSFESVPQIMIDLVQTEEDDNVEPSLLTGDYPFSDELLGSQFITNHLLIKAPLDMYQGSGIGDTIHLRWNNLTYANQTSDSLISREPFNGDIPEITGSFLSNSHTITEKIDSILYVENSNTIPLVGQIVETLTGFGEVTYTQNQGARLVIYIKEQNGTFGTVGSLTTSIGEFVGEYTTIGPINTAVDAEDSWGGYWRIETDSPYSVSNNNSDIGRGLVYVDVTPVGNVDQNRFYYNILDYSTTSERSLDGLNSQVITLSYSGNPGPGDVTGDVNSSLYVLRAPKEISDSLEAEGIIQGNVSNPKLDVFYNTMPPFLTNDLGDRALETIGLSASVVNKQSTVYDVWDGYIDFRITKNLGGVPIEPKVGLTVRDSTNLGTAEVVFYQKFDTTNGRIFVKNITGNWALGNIFRENREIEFLADGSGDPIYDPISGNRVFGQIEQRCYPFDSEGIGKFIVFDSGSDIEIQNADLDVAVREDTITNGEYWLYREQEVLGIPRQPNLPTVNNNDWNLIYNIPATPNAGVNLDWINNPDYNGLVNEGMYSIYERRGIGQFIKINSYVAKDRQGNNFLGSELALSDNNQFNRLFVKATNGGQGNVGKLYIINNGEINGTSYGWESARDKEYRGQFDIDTVYFTDEKVYFRNNLYVAITTTGPGEFNLADWSLINSVTDYLGYLPNTTDNIIGDDSTIVINNTGLLEFAKSFDTSKNGEVLVLTTVYEDATPNTIEVYRNVNGSFYKDQTIEAPNKNTNFGYNIAISNDGKLIAVGSPYDDTESLDQGKVYVYKQVSGVFELSQELYSPLKEKAELFGWTVDFDGNRLIIGSRNGDSQISTTFDNFVSPLGTQPLTYINYGLELDSLDLIVGYNKGIDLDVLKDRAVGFYLNNPDYPGYIAKDVYTELQIGDVVKYQGIVYTVLDNSKYTYNGAGVPLWPADFDSADFAVTTPAPIYEDYYIFKDQIVKYQGKTYVVLEDTTYSPVNFDLTKVQEISPKEVYARFVNDNTASSNVATSFDNKLTNFKSVSKDTGNIKVYERYNDTIWYAQTIDYDVPNVSLFGTNMLLKNNHVYVGLPTLVTSQGTRTGAIVDYRIQENTQVWNVLREAKPTVDVSKIKRAILYDKSTNEIVRYIDYIDPLQGKIAGPADQELTYKTYYDPATYTTGILPNTDVTNSWGSQQVGQLWWDLTNAKFKNPYQSDVIFSANNWNSAFSNINTVDVYEWVESKLLPSEWDKLSKTNKGITQGVTGQSRSGDDAYVLKRKYNGTTGTFTNYFYFWVKNKTTLPEVEFRKLNARDVADLILNPAAQGYRFISLISNNQFGVHNCDDLMRDQDIVLSIQYWTIENQDINIHNQYQIVTEGLETSIPKRDIQNKWFDSLVGYDRKNRQVPSPELSPKERYGTLNSPRQGWFVNREEALKQTITRINSVLKSTLIADDKDITPLTQTDPAPTKASRRWDRTVESLIDLQFVGVAKAQQGQLEAVIENGKIVRVNIIQPGRGYLQAPTVNILGVGKDADIETVIDNQGRIVDTIINNEGVNYNESTVLSVRRYTVLVEADETLLGKWAIYERNVDLKEWILVESQSYDVTKYWNYVDWYADGYNIFTKIDFVVDFPYDLPTINDNIGNVIKINNVGSGGWLLLEKIDAQIGVDYSVNYKTIGRESGTIQFKNTLYDVEAALVGFDTTSYDILSFDNLPTSETRIILDTVKNNIFINDLLLEYNKLFFAGLRYVFSEQNYVDWAFKTSFLKAKHNVGTLEQKINFQNDNLPSYEEYIKEVKPYKTKIREYLSSYEADDNSQSVVSDFDLPARYVSTSDSIQPLRVKTSEGGILADNPEEINTYPNKNWLDNAGYKIIKIELKNAGKGYVSPPSVTISGGGTGATAKATLGRNGSVNSIDVITQGNGYVEAPTVTLNGSIAPGGQEASAFAIIGDSPVRSLQTIIKFDRVSGTYEFVNLNTTEVFVSSGKITSFNLNWPMDLRTTRITVFENGDEVLSRRYTFSNILDKTKGYDRYYGQIQFINPPAVNAEIRVEYFKSINLLKAQDRINLAYDPTGDNFGKTLGQLMDGIDYGGVEVRSFDFGGTTGWNSAPWMSQSWDIFDTTFEDEVFRLDGSTISIELSKPLEDGIEYNLYRMSYDINGQLIDNRRMDDPNFGTNDQTNENATMLPITGDGETTTIFLDELNVPVSPEDSTEQSIVIIVRKSSSDGSFIADPESYDTAISGGDLVYSTATGLDAASINIDGDGFVTPTTSGGPEEIVPGQVMDTLDIQVFEKPTGGASQITSRNYIGDGVQRVFDVGSIIGKTENLFVKINYEVLDKTQYTFDFNAKTILFNIAPAIGEKISLINVGPSAGTILEIDTFTGNGTAIEFLTNVRYQDTSNAYVTVDGVQVDVTLFESDNNFENEGNFVVSFAEPPRLGSRIDYMIAAGGIEVFQQYSTVTIDEFEADGSTMSFDLNQAPFEQQPDSAYVLVEVNNQILEGGYSQTFEVKQNLKEYQLDLTQIPVASINSYDLLVYLNGTEIEYLQTWTFEGAGSFDSTADPQSQPGSTITLTAGIGDPGDELKVYVISSGEYRMGYYESDNNFVKTPGTLYLDTPYNEFDKIKVYQFSNHNSQKFERQSFEVTEKTETTVGTDLYNKFTLLRKGFITLNNPAIDAEYVWVVKNGNLLTPSVDYSITANKKYVKLVSQPDEGDKLQVLHFANSVVVDKFGWRQFKDILNRTHYKRLQKLYQLSEPLNWYDKIINVVDASDLPEPDVDAKYPGVIFIEGERIEYFGKSGNELTQLRRGTLGTSIKEVYDAGTQFMEQGVSATIPYNDETQITSSTSGGYNTGIDDYENSVGMNVTSITYNFNNNTAFPVRVPGVYEQICTVIGEGFTNRVKVLVGDTECETRFVSDTELNFDVPGFNVPGAFDLIVINPATNIPIDTPQTSFVVPGGIKYVQILLPYAPIPNPTSATGWYKDTIPEEYWEAQDIEVFTAGQRLRKTPLQSYNYLNQDSPEGDVTLEAEFAVNKNVGAYVRLTTPPPIGTTVNIFRKVGTLWADIGTSIAESDSNIAKFLRGSTTDLPR